MAIVIDTTLFIDLQRQQPNAIAYLAGYDGDLFTTWITIGELLEGKAEPFVRRLVNEVQVLPIDWDVCEHYGAIRSALRASGQMIGANDLWIAAIALANDLPVVTRNADEFGRVPGLAVIRY